MGTCFVIQKLLLFVYFSGDKGKAQGLKFRSDVVDIKIASNLFPSSRTL